MMMAINLALSDKSQLNMDDCDDNDGDEDEDDSDDNEDAEPRAQQQECFSLNRSALELRKGSPPPPQSESFY